MANVKDNTCKGIQQTIGWCMGTPEIGGVRRAVYYLAVMDIVAQAEIPKDARQRPTGVELVGDYIFAADVEAQRIDILPEKSNYKSDPQGDYPSQSQLDKLNLFVPSVGPDASAAACYINNCPCIFFFQDTQGRWRVCGNVNLPIKNTVALDGGEGVTGSPGTTIAVESTNIVGFPFYKGKLLTVDGEIDCSGADGSIPGKLQAGQEVGG